MRTQGMRRFSSRVQLLQVLALHAIVASFVGCFQPCPFLRTSRFSIEKAIMSSTSSETDASAPGLVAVVGSANQDLTTYATRFPVKGETVLGSSFQQNFGGKGANQAVAAACLGIAPVTMICRVGKDSFGEGLLSNFRHAGVHYDESTTVLEDNTTTGVAPIIVETESGDNMIIVVPGANHALTPADVEASLKALPNKPSIVLVQLEIPPESALQALKTGKELGATTILNTAPAPEGWSLDEFLPYCDILIPNETELQSICNGSQTNGDEEAMARQVLDKGVKTVVVTLGARGALVVSKDSGNIQTTMISAPPDLPCRNDPVQDTVGAGDAFCGAFATYLSAGLSLEEAGTKACGVASMSVRKRGAQSSYPTTEDLPDCLRVSTASSKKKSSDNKPVITFVTDNKKKLEEVQKIMAEHDLPFQIVNRKVNLPEIQGDPEEIAKEKCRLAVQQIGGAVLIEDTSLCFNAFHGLPGPYIKWFLEKCGHDGLNDMLAGFDDKTAYAQTVVAFCAGTSSPVEIFDGRTDGKIVRPRGSLDFGWDPVFEPLEGKGKTYAEMTSDEKNAISHRSRSFSKLRQYLMEHTKELASKIPK